MSFHAESISGARSFGRDATEVTEPIETVMAADGRNEAVDEAEEARTRRWRENERDAIGTPRPNGADWRAPRKECE